MSEPQRPTTLTGIGADAAAALVKGMVGTPAIMAIVLLNTVMVCGWVWLFVQVSHARTQEMQEILTMLADCVKAKT